jgi:oligopeptide/dipeptide ABC transporter ATP-binding protein
MSAPVLDIRDLSVTFATQGGNVHALRRISLAVPPGEVVGIVGESGSGKSTLALAVMRLLPHHAMIEAETIAFEGRDLSRLDEAGIEALRGTRLSMVFQDPMTSLNPVRTVGDIMLDIQYRDRSSPRAAKLKKAAEALRRVGLPDPERQLSRYPFQFSGGMRQRIAIAMSLMQRPALLIADEVTTALDVTLEAQILHLLRELRGEINGSILFISHNLGAIAELCDRVVVLYAGEVVEAASVEDIFETPGHPYTRALIACDPARIAETTRELPVIPGDVPDLRSPPQGCIFAARCAHAVERCRAERPADVRLGPGHVVRCHFAGALP